MPQPHKVHELLSREELDELEKFAREPARSVDQCWDWMQAHGFTIGRSSVHRWLRTFLATDRFAASNDVARSLVDAAKAGGTVAISDAATLQLSQMLFEQLLRLQSDEQVDTKELWACSMALKNVVQGKRHVEKLKTEVAEALALAEKDAKAGGSAEAVVSKVREILGIKAAA
jgi:hypothetical protein